LDVKDGGTKSAAVQRIRSRRATGRAATINQVYTLLKREKLDRH
jgi:hypothetical protein